MLNRRKDRHMSRRSLKALKQLQKEIQRYIEQIQKERQQYWLN
jgi:hypothetical protein